MTRRRATSIALLIGLAGLGTTSTGVLLLGGLPWGLIAYGTCAVVLALAVVALWA